MNDFDNYDNWKQDDGFNDDIEDDFDFENYMNEDDDD